VIPALQEKIEEIGSRQEEIVEATEVLMKYEGYIEREKLIAEKLLRLEHIPIQGRIDYNSILSFPPKQAELTRIEPETNRTGKPDTGHFTERWKHIAGDAGKIN